MIALGFSNLVFLSYIFYLMAEEKLAVFRNRKFWLLMVGLIISMYLTYQYIPAWMALPNRLAP